MFLDISSLSYLTIQTYWNWEAASGRKLTFCCFNFFCLHQPRSSPDPLNTVDVSQSLPCCSVSCVLSFTSFFISLTLIKHWSLSFPFAVLLHLVYSLRRSVIFKLGFTKSSKFCVYWGHQTQYGVGKGAALVLQLQSLCLQSLCLALSSLLEMSWR